MVMGSTSNATPVASDGGKMGGKEGFRSRGSRFEWVSSSPPPATVTELERRFPDVVQVPLQELELEMSDWGSKAIIARSLLRWIPPEAIVREFRRAGAAGEIEVISLAFRHYLIRFSDPDAKSMVMSNPWVVNGQAIAMEDWRQEFVPSEASISSALIWIRLPSLPMEFWTEAILRAITAAAGRFVFLDSATLERKRGGYARVCVQVDLMKPLRPGIRVRGTALPFWQSFVYEHLEGFCSLCGALHSSEGCPADSASAPASSAPLYGPWMSAVRRRSAPQTAPRATDMKSQKASASSSPGNADGWQLPKKTARRQPGKTTGDCSSVLPGGSGVAGEESLHPIPDGVPGEEGVVERMQPVKEPCQTLFNVPVLAESSGMAETLKHHSNPISANPFSLLGSDKAAGRPKSRKEANHGPLKRARPIEPVTTRVGSRILKGKGKVSGAGKQVLDPTFSFSASLKVSKEVGPPVPQGPLLDQVSATQGPDDSAVDSKLSTPEHRSHNSVVSLLRKAMQEAGDGTALDSQGQCNLAENPSDSESPDTEMLEDREDPPQSQ